MKNAGLTFRDLIAPVDAERFFGEVYRQRPLHVPGPPDKLVGVFSWIDLNAILRMTTIWSDHNCEVSLDGNTLRPEAYCYQGSNRDNVKSWKPDFAVVRTYLRDGATLTLNFLERLTPALQDLSQTLAAVLCAPVNCSAFLSWQGRRGYPSHFDTTNVFVLQIAGSKRWNLYERRLPGAAHTQGSRYIDFPQEHHERVKGAVLQEVTMTPGDLLYLPHGQYHDALATGEQSLHLSFAVRHLVAQDFVDMLARDLPKDPLFRTHLPQIDDLGGHERFRQVLGERLRQVVADPKVGEDLRGYLSKRAFELVGDFRLPDRGDPRLFRVRWLGRQLERQGAGWRLNGRQSQADLDQTEGAIADWMLRLDYFSDQDMAEDFAYLDPGLLARALERMRQLGLIEVI
jgi:hypothetical protein